MADKRKPREIPPPKTGIKLKNKEQKTTQKEKPKVIADAAPDISPEKLPMPTEEAIRIEAQALAANQELIRNMKEFNKLLGHSILPENRSIKDKEYEQKVTSALTLSAQDVDKYEPGRGSLALSTFAVRQSLLLRDAGNRLAHEIELLKEKIQELQGPKIEKSTEDPSDATKKYILERAKELGVKVSIED